MEPSAAYIENDLFSCDKKASDEPKVITGEAEILHMFKSSPVVFDPRFDLKLEACVLELAYANNKIASLSNSRTRILAHQVESTYRIVNSLNMRFLLADEVGLGKTIEAGLVIKELMYRYGFKRVLIVCPASLLMQWQNEMEKKFNENFIILDRRTVKMSSRVPAGMSQNPWSRHDKAICSLDFIKNNEHIQTLKNSRWDAVIFDEAHRLRRDSIKSTLAYNVAEIIAANTKALLLLTATPFRGKLEELYYLIRVIDKNLLGPFQTFYNEYCTESSDLALLREKISSVVIRRTKQEVGGFTRRFASTIRFELYPEERRLYDETTRYVSEEFNRALKTENRAVGFVMTVFQKLLDSSSFALLSAFVNRKRHLEEEVRRLESGALISNSLQDSGFESMEIDELEDLDEEENKKNNKDIVEMQEEIKILDTLIAIAASIEKNKKGEKLKSLLKKLRRNGNKKFIIFTQFRTTQEYLRLLLSDFRVSIFNGSMDKDQKETAIQNFKDESEVLICTEAGGEGRNLQFGNILVNYDLPWSPLRIEQRIGRIHRFGQQSDVYIYNFSTKNTVAERVLEVLVQKIKLFEESIGIPDVLLGQIEDELCLNTLFMEIATGKKSKKRAWEEVDTKIENAKKSYEKLSELTVTKNLDFNYDEYYSITMKERDFTHKRIERFVQRLRSVDDTVNLYLGERDKRKNLYPVKKIQSSGGGLKKFGTFDSAVALENENIDFLAFGHPVIDMLMENCKKESYGGKIGIKAIKYKKRFIGIMFNYLVSFKSNTLTRELLSVVLDAHNLLDDNELDDIERESINQEGISIQGGFVPEGEISEIRRNAHEYFLKARTIIYRKIRKRILEHIETLDLSIDSELDKINDSSNKRIKELTEQMDRQECQKKWFGKDMRSAISRTKNEISRIEKERSRQISLYKKHIEVDFSINLMNAGILFTVVDGQN